MERVSFWKKIKKIWDSSRRLPIIPIIIMSVIIVCALFADLSWLGLPDIRLAPYEANEMSLGDRLTPPFFMPGGSTEHILGTDNIGRDILSRMIYGARVSLSVSVLVILIASVIGTILGMSAGYARGRTEAFIMRVTDAAMAFPALLIALLLAVSLGPSFSTVVLALSALSWAPFSRMMRGEVVRIREEDFVAQARITGASPARILIKHIFPNVVNTLVVMMTMSVGLVILIEASLSFLGAGVPATTPTWGSMASEGRDKIARGWWISLFPSLAIGLVVLSCNFLGDWIRDKMDPRLRQL
ncbi:MAG TPA: ABC transporter permease [Dehalococcoidia bacterium]|nr:ABC transporter permease [Dehalococcoidia bacterium]